MRDEVIFGQQEGQLFTRSRRPVIAGSRIAVLSAAPARVAWRGATVAATAVTHGLLLVALFGGLRHLPAAAEPPTIEMIEVPAVGEIEPHPEPSPAPEPALAMVAAAEPAPAVMPKDTPAPALSQADPASVEQKQPPAEAPVQPAAAPEVAVPAPLVIPTPPVEAKPFRSVARAVLSRPVLIKPAAPTGIDTPQATARPGATGDTRDQRRMQETLSGRIRDAVQAAVHCPAAARMMGQSGTAEVTFDYRDGAVVGGVQVARSSGMPMLDAAAVTAVRSARYPAAPSEALNQVLHLLVWVEEACNG